MGDGRLRELVAHTGSSIVTTCVLTGPAVFFALVSMVNWIVQTYKCTIMHTRLNKKRPPFLFQNKKETGMF